MKEKIESNDKLTPVMLKWGENMVDKICTFLTDKIRKEMPEIDDEKAEVINYGLQNIVGEIPKGFIIFGIAYILNILDITLLAFILMMPYRSFSGGFHLKTHIGCIIGTTVFYCGVALLSKYLVLAPIIKYILIALVWIFGMCMIRLYAPADTENVPILRKEDRKKKRILSYIVLTIGLIIAFIINNNVISNILIFGNLLQTFTITKLAYKLTNNKYGYEVYDNNSISNETV